MWGKSLQHQHPYKDEDAAQKHGLVLADMAHFQNMFPHLDFDSLVARIDPSVAKFDHGYLAPLLGAVTQQGSDSGHDSDIDQATQPGTTHDLQPIFADPAEAAAICEYHRLSHEHSPNLVGVVRHGIQQLEEAFPHLNFPEILRIAVTVFPEYFDQRFGAAAQNTGPNQNN